MNLIITIPLKNIAVHSNILPKLIYVLFNPSVTKPTASYARTDKCHQWSSLNSYHYVRWLKVEVSLDSSVPRIQDNQRYCLQICSTHLHVQLQSWNTHTREIVLDYKSNFCMAFISKIQAWNLIFVFLHWPVRQASLNIYRSSTKFNSLAFKYHKIWQATRPKDCLFCRFTCLTSHLPQQAVGELVRRQMSQWDVPKVFFCGADFLPGLLSIRSVEIRRSGWENTEGIPTASGGWWRFSHMIDAKMEKKLNKTNVYREKHWDRCRRPRRREECVVKKTIWPPQQS